MVYNGVDILGHTTTQTTTTLPFASINANRYLVNSTDHCMGPRLKTSLRLEGEARRSLSSASFSPFAPPVTCVQFSVSLIVSAVHNLALTLRLVFGLAFSVSLLSLGTSSHLSTVER
jgi:hypothetical protein